MNEIIEFSAGHFNSINKTPGKKFSNFRKVKFFEIELFTNDYFYTKINGEKYPYSKNTVIISKPNDIRNSKLHFECNYIHILFNDGELKKFFENSPTSITITDTKKYQIIFNKMSELFATNGTKFEVLAQMYSLISLLQSDISCVKLFSNKPRKSFNIFHSACHFIETNYQNNITLNDISKHVNLHPNYFIRLFKKAYGETPIIYLQKIRIAHAKYLLINSDNKIIDIAIECGFSSQTYFTYVFTKTCKISPIQYRDKFKKPL